MFNLLKSYFFRNKTFFICALGFLCLEYFQLSNLYNGATIVAGGDSYIHLLLGKYGLYPYAWDNSIPFGSTNYNIANLLGFQLYSEVFKGIPVAYIQRGMFFVLYLLKFVAFTKLTTLFAKNLSVLALFPALLIYSYSAFASLSPIAYFPLMYGIYLPFSIYYFIKLVDSPKISLVIIAKLLILSIIFSPINSNLALSITIFIPQLVYLLVNFKKINYLAIFNLVFYGLGFVLVNLWWFIPFLQFFLNSASAVLNGGSWFQATAAGYLFQNFRFMGQWGWYGGHFLHLYYPFSSYYDNPTIIIVSYVLVIFAFYESMQTDSNKVVYKHKTFLFALTLIALFLISGSRYPLGFFYQFLFDHLPGFKIFREPFTKFGELYLLPISVFFYLFLSRLELNLKGFKKTLFFLAVFISSILIVKPALMGEHVPSFWNGSVRTIRVEEPKYWQELEKYAKLNLQGSRVIASPNSAYGGAWNWPKGFSSADDVAVNFLYDDVNVIRYPLPTGADSDLLLTAFYDALKNGNNFEKYLSLIGADYVLQENDFDWRYTTSLKTPIEINNDLNKKLIKVSEFGYFDQKYLETIPNEDPDQVKKDLLQKTLLNQPALVLYKVPENLHSPKIYVAQNVYLIDKKGKERAYPSQVVSDNFGSRDIFLWSDDFQKELPLKQETAKLEFTKINPTKYKIAVSEAPKQYLIQFSERFDKGWELTSSRSQQINLNHFKTNGYSNGWLIDNSPKESSNSAQFELNFAPQKSLSLNLKWLLFCFSISALIIIYDQFKKHDS